MKTPDHVLAPRIILRTLVSFSRGVLRRFQIFFQIAALAQVAGLFAVSQTRRGPATEEKPNFVLIVADNLGYGDIGCFGSKLHRTPHIDQMADQGMRMTSFYSTSGVCTPSRASLMTGCYPRRVGLATTDPDGLVLRPVSPNGLHPDEITIAEVLKERGYATAIIGKWHLGDQPPFLPTRQGFDYYFGIPYSDDMTADQGPAGKWPPLPLMRNEKVIEAPADRSTLTQRYTQEAKKFITANKDQPFFVYLSHAMPGSTLKPFASEPFQGKSANGPYGDSVEEMDWSAGEILEALKQLHLDDKTLVIFTSDNGAPRRDPPQGSNQPLSGRGYTATEAGMRVPFVARYPGKIPAGSVCDELTTMMDLLPTFARLANAAPPRDRIIDGKNIWPLLSGQPGAKSPHVAFFYYYMEQLQAVRSGKWKLHLPLEKKWITPRRESIVSPARLYDLDADIGETTDLADQHPDLVQQLLAPADSARSDLGDAGREGRNGRPAGRFDDPQPQVISAR